MVPPMVRRPQSPAIGALAQRRTPPTIARQQCQCDLPATSMANNGFQAYARTTFLDHETSTGKRVGGFIDKICHASANLWALVPCSDFASRPFLVLSEFCPARVREGSRDVTSATAKVEKAQE